MKVYLRSRNSSRHWPADRGTPPFLRLGRGPYMRFPLVLRTQVRILVRWLGFELEYSFGGTGRGLDGKRDPFWNAFAVWAKHQEAGWSGTCERYVFGVERRCGKATEPSQGLCEEHRVAAAQETHLVAEGIRRQRGRAGVQMTEADRVYDEVILPRVREVVTHPDGTTLVVP